MKQFYTLRSKSQIVHNTPFLADNDSEAISIIVKSVSSYADASLVYMLDDLQLCRVGLFDPTSDTPVKAVSVWSIVLDDLHKALPLPPHIKSQIDKIYKEVDND